VFLRHLRGTVFFDAANAFTGPLRLSDLKTAAGASVGIDTALGYALPATAELTVARAFNLPVEGVPASSSPAAERRDTRVYLRFGLAF
jgi:hypothetical protein